METSVNNKCKAFTSLEQSKKLAEILPLESADMMYHSVENEYGSEAFVATSKIITNGFENDNFYIDDIPCWSLAALLKCLSEIKPQVYIPTLFPSEGKWILHFVEYGHGIVCAVTCDNPVDACVAMIEKLNKLKML